MQTKINKHSAIIILNSKKEVDALENLVDYYMNTCYEDDSEFSGDALMEKFERAIQERNKKTKNTAKKRIRKK